MSAAPGHGEGTCGNDRHAEAHGRAWDKDPGTGTEGHTDIDPALRGTHRQETLRYRRGGTVHIGGCTQRHAWKHGHGPGPRREMWLQVQRHCAHTEGHTDGVTLCMGRQAHTQPRQGHGTGWHSQDRVQGMCSDGALPGNTRNAALGKLVPQLGPCHHHPPSKGSRTSQQCNIPHAQDPQDPAHLTAPVPRAGPAAPAGPS